MVDAEEHVEQREGASVEVDAIPHRCDAGILRRHQRQEFIAQAGRQAGEIIGGIALSAACEVDDSR